MMDTALLRQTARAWTGRAVRTVHALLTPPPDATDTDLLPDFCSGWIVFNVVVVAELVAIVINLLLPSGLLTATPLLDLLVVSVFVQWVALAGTAALCKLRGYFNRLPSLRAVGLAYGVLIVVAFLVGEVAVLLLWAIGKISTLRPAWYSDFQVFNLTISAIANGMLLRFFLAKHELMQRTRSEARARVQAQLARIRPHFVFNSLNIIASLTRTEPAKAEAAIEDMADLFRMMLSEDEMLVPVKNEIDVAKKYIALESLRLDSRLTVNWDVGSYPRKASMPVLTLQPILEYAIRHGIEDRTEGGALDVELREENDALRIRVAAPSPRSRSRREDAARDRTIENIRLRLQNHYGEAAGIESHENAGQTVVTAAVPLRGGKP
jgi:two-component system sensor histidine kinase AlgZ